MSALFVLDVYIFLPYDSYNNYGHCCKIYIILV